MAVERFRKIGLVGIIITLIIITINTSAAAPLQVNIEEKIGSTVTPDGIENNGNVQFSYQTNVTGFVNITNNDPDDYLYDVWVAVDIPNLKGECSYEGSRTDVSAGSSLAVPDKINKQGVFNTSGANCFIHIPVLAPGETVSVFYDVNDSEAGLADGAPFVVEERYDPFKIPSRGEFTWTVYLNVSPNITWLGNTQLPNTATASMKIVKYLSNDTMHFGSQNWKTLKVVGTPTTNNGNVNTYSGNYTGAADSTIVFSRISLNLNNPSNSVNTSFQVEGNYTSNDAFTTRFEPFGFAVFEFSISSGNVSGAKVVDVFAFGNASIAVNKSGPDANNNWMGNATITNTASGLTYVVTNVTLWATQQGDFSNYVQNNNFNNLNCSGGTALDSPNVICGYEPNQQLTESTSYTTGNMEFTYDQVPIIWANATFKLIEDDTNGWGTASNTANAANITYGSDFIVIEKIYVIGTYLVKVTKYVQANASAGDNVFDVWLVVENLGGERSPYVYVYDLIPERFSEYNWNDNWTDVRQDGNWVNNSSMFSGIGNVNNPMGGYTKGYWWRLYPLEGGANGDGDYMDYDEIDANQSVVIFYQVQGSGDFKVLDAFLVGIDPMLSMNEQTSPKITLVSGAKATSYESVMALATAFAGLVAIVSYRKRS
ncbi:MAG: hypothetical protein H0Z19_02265 [Archaeoglobus sp.]|uniref:hypothetical protein n=1 Tax=Archaeoglobus sp. TaxID=1872626 RepID=UPI001D260D7D|nr:hypothetical protein [Archaeoglobus sp.]MBO8179298.1 hypothetical protein [Archaeoglobus sp.]